MSAARNSNKQPHALRTQQITHTRTHTQARTQPRRMFPDFTFRVRLNKIADICEKKIGITKMQARYYICNTFNFLAPNRYHITRT